MRRIVKSVSILLIFGLINIFLFEFFGDSSLLIQKERQLLRMLSDSNVPHFVSAFAAYIHERTPYLEMIPYATPQTDSRLSTWYLPPHQVVVEWIFFASVFAAIIAHGYPVYVGKLSRNFEVQARLAFRTCLATLLVVFYYKVRAWLQLGEWFAMLYLLQPCHVLLAGYTWVSYLLLRGNQKLATPYFHVLFDLQWFTYVAVALPDTSALIEREFAGELFLFYFEHVLLMVLPLWLVAGVFHSANHPSTKERVFRALLSLAWFGIHHIQVMTPISLVSGIQINYQTHLPEYALPWFGRWYKGVITAISFLAILAFSFLVDPVVKRYLSTSMRK
jgi:hypothetical protein